MGVQREQRVKAVLPVRVWGADAAGKEFVAMAHTLDVSRAGARIAGVKVAMRVGDTVGLQYRNVSGRFRVTWVAVKDKEPHLGLQSLQPEKEFWRMALPRSADSYVPTSAAAGRHSEEREQREEPRKHARFPVNGTAHISAVLGGAGRRARLADISSDGCYVQTDSPSEVNSRIALLLRVNAVEIVVYGVVRVSVARTGMGVQFTEMSPSDGARLKALIAQLEGQSPFASAPKA